MEQVKIDQNQCFISKNYTNVVKYKKEEGFFKTVCPFCYVFCHNNSCNPDSMRNNCEIIENGEDQQLVCDCQHQEDHDFFQQYMKKILTETDISIGWCQIVNGFLSHSKDGKSCVEMAMSNDLMEQFQQDFDGFKNQSFNWHEISEDGLMERVTFVENLSSFIQNLKNKKFSKRSGEEVNYLQFINFNAFKQILSLQRIGSYILYPNFNFGQNIYNKSVQFYTHIIQFLVCVHLQPDLANFQKIKNMYSQNNGTIQRHIFKKQFNDNCEEFKEKYFNKQFDICQFTLRCVENFIPPATWRWVGGKHEAHVFSVKICKILVLYNILTPEQTKLVQNILIQKIQILKQLEVIIRRDSSQFRGQVWLKKWNTGLTKIRSYYGQIFLSQVMTKLDNKLIAQHEKIQKEGQPRYTQEYMQKLQEQIKSKHIYDSFVTEQYTDTIWYKQKENESEYMQLMIVFNLYLMDVIEIDNGLTCISQKTHQMISVYFSLFFNIHDVFLQNIRALETTLHQANTPHFHDYIAQNYIEQETDEEIITEIEMFKMQLLAGKFALNPVKQVYSLRGIVDLLHQCQGIASTDLIEIGHLITTSEHVLQFSFHQQSAKVLQDEYEDIWLALDAVNAKMQSTGLLYYQSQLMQSIKQKANGITEEFLSTEGHGPRHHILLGSHQRTLHIMAQLRNIFKQPEQQWKNNYIQYSRLIREASRIFIHLHSHKNQTTSSTLLDYNFQFQKFVSEILNKQFKEQCIDKLFLEALLHNQKEKMEDMRVFFELLGLVLHSVEERLLNQILSVLLPLVERITGENSEVFERVGEDMVIKQNLMGTIMCIVGFKEQLIESRQNYYQHKPNDQQYEEDMYYHNFTPYLYTIIQQLNWLLLQPHSLTPVQLHSYASLLFLTLLKFTNFIQVQRENTINEHILHQTQQFFQSTVTFLLANIPKIIQLFDLSPDFQSILSNNEEFSDEILMKISFKIQREKFMLMKNVDILSRLSQYILKSNLKFRSEHIEDDLQQSLHCYQPSPRLIRSMFITSKSYINNFSNYQQPNIPTENIKATFYQIPLSSQHPLDLGIYNLLRKEIKLANISNYFNPQPNRNSTLSCQYLLHKAVTLSPWYNIKEDKDQKLSLFSYFRDQNNEQFQQFLKKQCIYIITQWKTSFTKNHYYYMNHDDQIYLEMLCSLGGNCQDRLVTVLAECISEVDNENNFLDFMWCQMKYALNFIRYKCHYSFSFKQRYEVFTLHMRFQLQLVHNHRQEFQKLFTDKQLPNDSIERLQRYTTMFQKISDDYQLHYNYNMNYAEPIPPKSRARVFLASSYIFQCIQRYCVNYDPAVLKVYTYIYDRYRGIIKKFVANINSDFYVMKSQLLSFLITMADSQEQKVAQYLTTNFEVHNFIKIMCQCQQLLVKYRYQILNKKKKNQVPQEDFNQDCFDFNQDLNENELRDFAEEFSQEKIIQEHPIFSKKGMKDVPKGKELQELFAYMIPHQTFIHQNKNKEIDDWENFDLQFKVKNKSKSPIEKIEAQIDSMEQQLSELKKELQNLKNK